MINTCAYLENWVDAKNVSNNEHVQETMLSYQFIVKMVRFSSQTFDEY